MKQVRQQSFLCRRVMERFSPKKILSPQFQLYRGFMDNRETKVRKSTEIT